MCFDGWITHDFFVLNNIPLPGGPQLVPALTEKHLGYFQVWEIMGKGAINIFVPTLCLSLLVGNGRDGNPKIGF